jgi:hypothetical protein
VTSAAASAAHARGALSPLSLNGIIRRVIASIATPYSSRSRRSQLTKVATEHMRSRGMDIAVIETGGDPGHAPARAAYETAGFTLLPIARYFRLLA